MSFQYHPVIPKRAIGEVGSFLLLDVKPMKKVQGQTAHGTEFNVSVSINMISQKLYLNIPVSKGMRNLFFLPLRVTNLTANIPDFESISIKLLSENRMPLVVCPLARNIDAFRMPFLVLFKVIAAFNIAASPSSSNAMSSPACL